MLSTVWQSQRLPSSSLAFSKLDRTWRYVPQRFLSHTVLKALHHVDHHLDHIAQSVRPHTPSIAHKMLDDRLLHKLYCDSSAQNRDVILRSYLDLCQTAAEKHETVVSFSFLHSYQWLYENACLTCLYSKAKCICPYIQKTLPAHKLWLFQHHGEYGRANNTGSLLCTVTDAVRTIRGFRDQEQRLLNHAAEREHSVIVLFPTHDSLTVDEYISQRSARMGSTAETEALTLVLLDGTSRQAKNLERFMPNSIPRVRISKACTQSWLEPIRKQTEKHRVCTAQAAAMILRELGDVKTCEAIEDAVRHVVRISCSRRVKPLKENTTAVVDQKC